MNSCQLITCVGVVVMVVMLVVILSKVSAKKAEKYSCSGNITSAYGMVPDGWNPYGWPKNGFYMAVPNSASQEQASAWCAVATNVGGAGKCTDIRKESDGNWWACLAK